MPCHSSSRRRGALLVTHPLPPSPANKRWRANWRETAQQPSKIRCRDLSVFWRGVVQLARPETGVGCFSLRVFGASGHNGLSQCAAGNAVLSLGKAFPPVVPACCEPAFPGRCFPFWTYRKKAALAISLLRIPFAVIRRTCLRFLVWTDRTHVGA